MALSARYLSGFLSGTGETEGPFALVINRKWHISRNGLDSVMVGASQDRSRSTRVLPSRGRGRRPPLSLH